MHSVQVLWLYSLGEKNGGCLPSSPRIRTSLLVFFFFFWLLWVLITAQERGSSLCFAGSFVSGCRLSSCGTGASVVAIRGLSYTMTCGILVPWPGIEPACPESQGRLPITGPLGKSICCLLKQRVFTLYPLFTWYSNSEGTIAKLCRETNVFWTATNQLIVIGNLAQQSKFKHKQDVSQC